MTIPIFDSAFVIRLLKTFVYVIVTINSTRFPAVASINISAVANKKVFTIL